MSFEDLCEQEKMAPETRNAARKRSVDEDDPSTSNQEGQSQFEVNREASQHIAGNVRERIQQLEAALNKGNESPNRFMLRRDNSNTRSNEEMNPPSEAS